ncbi:MAG TPA: polymer-forming cytoskeletal protein [Pyrinomonadaceae bacterium]|nr:polymer-forming cytoskeletal protein [Pyrinomonadaceae bacterium]
MSQEAETLTFKPVPILSPEDSRPDLARDPDEVVEDWLNVSDTSRNETDHPLDSVAVATPLPPREIAFEGNLRINGYAAGVIRSDEGHLIVEADGEVDADISVHDATINGCVRGDIRAKRKVELGGSARVVGDIETVALSIEPGAVFEGRCIFVHAAADDSSMQPESS